MFVNVYYVDDVAVKSADLHCPLCTWLYLSSYSGQTAAVCPRSSAAAAFNAFMLLVWQLEGHPACTNLNHLSWNILFGDESNLDNCRNEGCTSGYCL